MSGFAADRNLLFAILSLQNGFITGEEQIAGTNAWFQQKHRSVGEIMVELSILFPEDREALDHLVDRHIARNGGSAAASLGTLESAGPMVDKLRQAVDADPDLIGSMNLVPRLAKSIDPYQTVVPEPVKLIETTARFNKLRSLAKGNLGVVWVANDEEFQRSVAFKEINEANSTDPEKQTRFILEAEITGGLEHPGIVPVYGLGRYISGEPYYAMRLIRGEEFLVTIQRFHKEYGAKADPGKRLLALQRLIRHFIDICNAIAYAHSRGVIHRDIKPGNVMIGKRFGETLVVDWGLAKLLEQPGQPAEVSDDLEWEGLLTPRSASLVETEVAGTLLGTPPYMSPEQAAGRIDLLGPASDIYGLGATLYHLLVGKQPHAGFDRQETLARIQEGTLDSPRSIVPWIDRALEKICLKAMAPNPRDRYASAIDLAEDLERWAADEPVSAWKEPPIRRVQRYLRRHGKLVAALIASVVVIMGLEWRSNRALEAKNKDLAAANKRVEARFELARKAIRTFQTGVEENEVLKNPELQALRKKLLQYAVGFYQELETLLKAESDRKSRATLAESYEALAKLIDEIDRKADALKVYRQALALRRELAAQSGDGPQATADLAKTLLETGIQLAKTGDKPVAQKAYYEARTLARRLSRAHLEVGEYREILADSLIKIGVLNGDIESHKEAREILKQLVEEVPGLIVYQNRLAKAYHNIANILMETGNRADARQAYQQALEIENRVVKAQPREPEYTSSLAHIHNNYAALLSGSGDSAGAMRSYEFSLELRQRIAADNPAVTTAQIDIAASLQNIGMQAIGEGKLKDGLAAFERAISIVERIAEANAEVVEYQEARATAYSNFSVALARVGHLERALDFARRGVAIRQRLADAHPEVNDALENLIASLLHIATYLANSKDHIGAMKSSEQALAILEQRIRANPGKIDLKIEMGQVLNNIGQIQMNSDNGDEALKFFEKARSARQDLVNLERDVAAHRDSLAMTLDQMAVVLQNRREFDRAWKLHAEALTIRQKLVDDHPGNFDYQINLAGSHNNIGIHYFLTGKFPESLASLRRALAIQKPLLDRNPSEIRLRYDLEVCLDNIGELLQDILNDPPGALEAFREARPLCDLLIQLVPTEKSYKIRLTGNLFRSAKAELAIGRVGEAAINLRRAISTLEANATTAEDWYNLACFRSLVISIAARPGSGLKEFDPQIEGQAAVSALCQAIEAGFVDLNKIQGDHDLDPTRNRPDFQTLIRDLIFPTKPFEP